jgi:hypothetical protein
VNPLIISGYFGVDGEARFTVIITEASDPNLAVHLIVAVVMDDWATAVSL